jgi:hypothetical protein
VEEKLDGLGANMRHRASTLHFSCSSDFFQETRWREENGRAFERLKKIGFKRKLQNLNFI